MTSGTDPLRVIALNYADKLSGLVASCSSSDVVAQQVGSRRAGRWSWRGDEDGREEDRDGVRCTQRIAQVGPTGGSRERGGCQGHRIVSCSAWLCNGLVMWCHVNRTRCRYVVMVRALHRLVAKWCHTTIPFEKRSIWKMIHSYGCRQTLLMQHMSLNVEYYHYLGSIFVMGRDHY